MWFTCVLLSLRVSALVCAPFALRLSPSLAWLLTPGVAGETLNQVILRQINTRSPLCVRRWTAVEVGASVRKNPALSVNKTLACLQLFTGVTTHRCFCCTNQTWTLHNRISWSPTSCVCERGQAAAMETEVCVHAHTWMLNDDSFVTSVDTLQMGTGANWVDGGLLRWRNLEIHLCLSGQSRKAHFNKPLGRKHPQKLSHISSACMLHRWGCVSLKIDTWVGEVFLFWDVFGLN